MTLTKENKLQWLEDLDENIFSASVIDIDDINETGIALIIGDTEHLFEIILTKSELKKIIKHLK